jgi:ribosomal protein S18 acetylase RimI-like enzyme
VRPATDADLARLCRTAMRAFVDDPVMRFLYPDDDEYEALGGQIFRYVMRRWLAWGATWTTQDGVGVAAWIPPGRPDLTVERDETDGPFPSAPDRIARFQAVAAAIASHTPPEPHWYLNLLATHPDWQRQGIGRMLMAPAIERAEAEGLGCYLETETVENVAYYRRSGFEVRSEWDVDGGGPHMWGMWRPAPSP